MKELSNSEVNLVSGAGKVTNNEVGARFPYEITGTLIDPNKIKDYCHCPCHGVPSTAGGLMADIEKFFNKK